MAVDLHTGDTTALPSQLLPTDEDDRDDDFIAELTHRMAHFMLQDDDTFIGSQTQNLELSWDLTGSPQSTLWSPMGCNQGSPEGSSQEEPSPPATPGKKGQDSWLKTTYDVVGGGMFENIMKPNNERGNYSNYFQSSNKSCDIEQLCSYQSLIQEQIRAIELSRLKQEQVLSPNRRGQTQGQISRQPEYPKQKIQQFQKKGNGNGRRTRPPPRPTPQTGSGMRAVFLGGSGSRGGTGVFLPRGGSGTGAPSESTNKKKQGKGCSTVLIPARVVQALQLHFDKTAAMSGPKVPAGFPPLHDHILSNRDGIMYSVQKPQQYSTRAPADIQNEMILPREWTY